MLFVLLSPWAPGSFSAPRALPGRPRGGKWPGSRGLRSTNIPFSYSLILLVCDPFEQLHKFPDVRKGIVEGRRGYPDDVGVTVVALKERIRRLSK